MKIQISVKEAKELLLHVFASDASSRLDTRKVLCDTLAGRGAGRWVSHPIADLTKQPPSVMTVSTTEDAQECGADIDIDKKNDGTAECAERCDAYARAESVANFIIKNLLDFESWLDERLFNDDDATVERVRFHTDVSYDGRSITMRHLTEYKNADRCKVPREDGRIMKWAVPPDDDFLEDFEAGAVRSCVRWACNGLGIEIEEYLDKDEEAVSAEQDEETSGHNEVRGEITGDAATETADEEAAYVWSIVSDMLSALERWAESKAGKPLISVGVTLSGDTVIVRIARHSDKDCDPLMVRQTKVKKGCSAGTYVNRILSEAYNVVFGTFEELSYSEFSESISVAADGR